MKHAWRRAPYLGGCAYYCAECGVEVFLDYPETETETSSNAYRTLQDMMSEVDKATPCGKIQENY